MTMRVRLEVFQAEAPAAAVASGTVVTDLSALEEARLAAYEQGYAAGWDDAAAAAESDRSKMGADLSQHLQTLGFTYHEARAHVLRAIEPLLSQMTRTVLPAMARDALGPVILEVLRPLAAQMALVPVELALHPEARPAVEQALLMEASLPLAIVEDATLGTAEARLRLGETERHIALEEATAAIAAAVTDFFHLTLAEESRNG
jgi:flagellar biosynthesis/type III secretory pathway protein FliH